MTRLGIVASGRDSYINLLEDKYVKAVFEIEIDDKLTPQEKTAALEKLAEEIRKARVDAWFSLF